MSVGETILTGTINTTGSQTYQSNVTIEGDVELNAVGDVSFSNEVSGNQNGSASDPDLIINTQADTTFGGTVSTWQHSLLMLVARLLQRPTTPPATRPTTISLCSTPA